MNFDDSDEGEESLLYETSDEEELSPPPTPPPPPRRRPVEVNLEMEESDFQAVQDRIRHIQSSFLDDADALQRASKKSDEAALRYAAGVVQKVSGAPVSSAVAYVTPKHHRKNKPVVEVSMLGPQGHDSRGFEDEGGKPATESRQHTKARPRHGNKGVPRPKPGSHVSAETLSLLYANNPRSKFVKSQTGGHSAPVSRKTDSRSDKRKEIERRLEGLMDYEIPANDKFTKMRRNLLDVNDKMVEHRFLLDKYSGIDLGNSSSVSDQVEEKYKELADRMPELEERVRVHDDRLKSSALGVTGYSKGLVPNETQPVSELRGRIRRLICRSKNNPHYYRF